MDIPAEHNDWLERMRDSPDSDQVVKNMMADPCVSSADADAFFQRISDAKPFNDYSDAWEAAKKAAGPHIDGSDLCCKGKPVSEERFQQVVRIIQALDTQYVVGQDYQIHSGMSRHDLETCDFDDMNAFVVGFNGKEGGHIGKPGGIAWVAENSKEIEVLYENGLELTNRLGLPDQHESVKARGMYVRIHFEREDIPEKLHVPRIWDAIGHPPFRPNPDCNAPYGVTHPLEKDDGENAEEINAGFPEAVHRACKVQKITLHCQECTS